MSKFQDELSSAEIFSDPVKRSGYRFSRMWVRLHDNDYRLFACLYLLIHILSKQMGTNKSSRTDCSPFDMHFWSNDGQRQSTFKCNHYDYRILIFKNIFLYFQIYGEHSNFLPLYIFDWCLEPAIGFLKSVK